MNESTASNALAIFHFDNQEIRFVNEKPVANDVAAVLGYADPAKTISTKVNQKNKGVADLVTPGGTQSVTLLEEAGLYQLIFSSKLPSAEQFQDWVFEEVLPSIRKTGKFDLRSSTEKAIEECRSSMIEAGIDLATVQSWLLLQKATIDPVNANIFKSASKLIINLSNPDSSSSSAFELNHGLRNSGYRISKSAMSKIPTEIITEINQKLIDYNFSNYQLIIDWLKSKNYKIGKSQLSRHAQDVKQELLAKEMRVV